MVQRLKRCHIKLLIVHYLLNNNYYVKYRVKRKGDYIMMDWNFVIENEGLINYLSWVYKTKISYCLSPTYSEDDFISDFKIYLAKEAHKYNSERGTISMFVTYKLTKFIHVEYRKLHAKKRKTNMMYLDDSLSSLSNENVPSFIDVVCSAEDDYSEYYIREIVDIVRENFKFKKKTNKSEKEILKEIIQTIDLLSKGYNNKDIAKLQKNNESTVSRRIRKIRKLLEEKYL